MRVVLAMLGAAATAAVLSSGAPAHEDPTPGAHPDYVGPPAGEVGPRTIEILARVPFDGDLTANVFTFRRRAYVGSYGTSRRCEGSGVRVVDLSNPRRPRRLPGFAASASDPVLAGAYTDQVQVRRVRTRSFTGDLALVGFQRCGNPAEGFRGFGLYDVTNPTRPRRLALISTAPAPGVHELFLRAKGTRAYAYLAVPRSELHTERGFDTGRGKPDFRIVDVSNPRRPREVGTWGVWKDLGVRPRFDRDMNKPNDFAHSVIVNRAATRAFVSYWDMGTVILDIRNPARPRLLARTRSGQTENANAHSAALTRNETLLVETREFGEFFGMHGPGYPSFFDISNPRRPRLLGTYRPGDAERSTVHDPKTRGRRAVFSWYDHGVHVVDISRATRPRRVATFVAPPAANANPHCTNCTFVWGVALGPDWFAASDMNSGLWVLHVECRVPPLGGRTLAQARAMLRAADCAAGTVRREYSNAVARGRVVSQSPRARTNVPYPGRVDLVVSLGRRP